MPSDAECAEALREVRWATGLQCLHCGGRTVVRRGWRKGLYRRYRCKGCGRWFNDRSGTVLTCSKLPSRTWFFAAFQMQSKVSVRELAETLQLPYPTVFRIVRSLRENLYMAAPTLMLKGVVELDEVYMKAGLKEKRGLRRTPRVRGLKRRGKGTYTVDKPPILGLVEQGGLVRLTPMADIAAKTVLRRLLKAVDVEDLEALYTDSYSPYRALRNTGCHKAVNHSLGEYALACPVIGVKWF
jgi:transposase-like protein